tara:strand:+ start:11942 stop:12253 length:312 start_codon:yes stop_codon:yes gene_type:complete
MNITKKEMERIAYFRRQDVHCLPQDLMALEKALSGILLYAVIKEAPDGELIIHTNLKIDEDTRDNGDVLVRHRDGGYGHGNPVSDQVYSELGASVKADIRGEL